MDKYNTSKYKSGYFGEGNNINLNLITFEDEIVIPLTL